MGGLHMARAPLISECDLAFWAWRKGRLGAGLSVLVSLLGLELSSVHRGAHHLLVNEQEHVSPVQVCASPVCLSSLSKTRSTRHRRASRKSPFHPGHLGLSQVTVKVKREHACPL